ncbi:MAG: hypothetical protein ACRYG8_06675 [Janthinobacterium lividum]
MADEIETRPVGKFITASIKAQLEKLPYFNDRSSEMYHGFSKNAQGENTEAKTCMTEEPTVEQKVDIAALSRLADQIDEDMRNEFSNLSRAAATSIASIVRAAIGAPVDWPTRQAGAEFADRYYAGDPSARMQFNHGVKWAVENYRPTLVRKRFDV